MAYFLVRSNEQVDKINVIPLAIYPLSSLNRTKQNIRKFIRFILAEEKKK